MIEVEQKFRLRDRAVIESKLDEMKYIRNSPVRQVDEVFLLGSGGFASFKPGDPVMRIRTVDGLRSFLTFKRDINAAGDRIEHEMAVDPASAAEGMLREMGYHVAVTVDKMRVEYIRGEITVTIDEVKGLGSFVEVEVVCQAGQEKTAREKMMAAARQLGLKLEDIETKKNDQMMSELTKA